ncbi:MAG: helix-turn-helix transcriptional regulator, partial [Oscillospiraceae bacterium]
MFAKRLKELRRLKGVSQVVLANILNVTQQAVGKWETE